MKFSQIWLRAKALPSFFYFTFLEKDKKKYIKNIEFIWNKKIAMSCDVYPIYYPKQIFFRSVLGKPLAYLSYKNIVKTKPKTIYVSLDFMDYFIEKFLPKISWKFVLITGDSDFSTSKYRKLLNNKYLYHWFAQNNDLESNKITTIPIGIDYHFLFTSQFFGENIKSPERQEREIINIKEVLGKNMKIFANFHLNRTSKRRSDLYIKLLNNPLIYFQKEKLPRCKMWKEQAKYAFGFSPVGAGLDCHRTWETLLLGQIPIIETVNNAMDGLHRKFPVVIINNISEISEENLKKWYKKYSKMFTRELERKLSSSFYIKKISEKSEEF